MSDAIDEYRISIPDAESGRPRAPPGPGAWPADLPVMTGVEACPRATCAISRSIGGRAMTGAGTRPRSTGSRSSSPRIDGQRIHFLHVRSSRADATPLFLTHGYPSSFVEFTRLIGMLTEPEEGPRSMSSSPRCPATGSRRRCPAPAGRWAASRGPGRSWRAGWDTSATASMAATSARVCPGWSRRPTRSMSSACTS